MTIVNCLACNSEGVTWETHGESQRHIRACCMDELDVGDPMSQFTCDLPKQHTGPHQAMDIRPEVDDEENDERIYYQPVPHIVFWPMSNFQILPDEAKTYAP